MKPKLLDLFCCQGGASEGYRRAGFDVYGVDLDPQPRYPFAFHRGDAIETLRAMSWSGPVPFAHHDGTVERLMLSDFDAIHASPPCQAFTLAQRLQGNEHPDLIGPIRRELRDVLVPWVIENVAGAPLIRPVELCGAMFGLETYRHRWFEASPRLRIEKPPHPSHEARTTKMGRRPVDGEYMHIVGNFSGVDRARRVMDMDWANRDGLREAIPPAYAQHIGRSMMTQIEADSW